MGRLYNPLKSQCYFLPFFFFGLPSIVPHGDPASHSYILRTYHAQVCRVKEMLVFGGGGWRRGSLILIIIKLARLAVVIGSITVFASL